MIVLDQEKSSAAQAPITGARYGGPCALLLMHFSPYYTRKLLPWQLDLPPHKRNTSNSFLRMPQIAHAQGISLKNTSLMLFLMSDRFRIPNQSQRTGKWRWTEYISRWVPPLQFICCMTMSICGMCAYAYLHMCVWVHVCAGRYIYVQEEAQSSAYIRIPCLYFPSVGL